MKIYVDFYAVEGDEDQKVGTLVWGGKSFTGKMLKKNGLKTVLDDPIYVDDDVIEAKKEPEKYIGSLYKTYYGAYFRASKPRIKEGEN